MRGERMTEVLKQGQYNPLPVSRQVMIIYCGVHGFLDDLPVSAVKRFEDGFFKYMGQQHPDIVSQLDAEKEISDGLAQRLNSAISAFKNNFS